MNEETPTTETSTTSAGDSGSARAESAHADATAATSTAGGDSGPEGASSTQTGPDGAPKKRRRRGKRGGRKHRKKPATGEGGSTDATGGEAATADAGPDAPTETAPKPASGQRSSGQRSSGQRSGGQRSGGQRRSPRAPAAKTDGAAEAPSEAKGDAEGKGSEGDSNGAAEGSTGSGTRRRRRGGRGRGGSGAKSGDKPATKEAGDKAPATKKDSAAKAAGSTRLAARAQRRQQRGRRPRRQLSEEEAAQLRGQEKVMLVHDHDDRTQIAVLEEGSLIEHYVARKGERTTMAGNVFMGKVQNVLPGMEAAFIDFGRGRNGVLYAGEVNYSAEDIEGDTPRRIEHVLKPGQKIMVQVTKDPIGNKGARLTTQLSLAGRYLVLAPEQTLTGISRRLAEKERDRLRKILKEIRPNGHGVIVRTAAEGASHEALKRDLEHLVKTWEKIQKDSKRAKAPSQLYAEPDLIQRVVRDEFSDDFIKLIVDSSAIHTDVKDYLESAAPDLLAKLELHDGPLPMFEEHRVSEQLAKALERKVWLPSGGSLIIEKVEALTVIDVNTGKFTGKGSTLEETVFANNLEAAEEVARQLRLRDIGGIIVIDFIDMIEQKNQRELLRTFKRALAKDKTRSQVFEVSNLGLVEMTRKKVSEGLLDAFSEPCPNCEGRGIVLTHEID